jgi:hypothetical protein
MRLKKAIIDIVFLLKAEKYFISLFYFGQNRKHIYLTRITTFFHIIILCQLGKPSKKILANNWLPKHFLYKKRYFFMVTSINDATMTFFQIKSYFSSAENYNLSKKFNFFSIS